MRFTVQCTYISAGTMQLTAVGTVYVLPCSEIQPKLLALRCLLLHCADGSFQCLLRQSSAGWFLAGQEARFPRASSPHSHNYPHWAMTRSVRNQTIIVLGQLNYFNLNINIESNRMFFLFHKPHIIKCKSLRRLLSGLNRFVEKMHKSG